jgi:hypothetical protein
MPSTWTGQFVRVLGPDYSDVLSTCLILHANFDPLANRTTLILPVAHTAISSPSAVSARPMLLYNLQASISGASHIVL